MKRILLLPGLLAVLVGLAHPAFGHMRWFVEDQAPQVHQHYSMDMTGYLVVFGALLFVVLSFVIDRTGHTWEAFTFLERTASRGMGIEWRAIAVLTGIMLAANAAMDVFLAPNISLPDQGTITVGKYAQMAVAILLIFQISFSVSGILVLVVAVLTLGYVPVMILVDYVFEFVSLAIALVFVGPNLSAIDRRIFSFLEFNPERFKQFPVPIIRVGVGITLCVLAVHNKLMNPELSIAFLSEYEVNFMPYLGFAAGVAELTFGVLLLSGIATRFVTAVLSIFFVLTLVVLGMIDLVGHAPLFGIVVLLIHQGSGSLGLLSKTKPAQAVITSS